MRGRLLAISKSHMHDIHLPRPPNINLPNKFSVHHPNYPFFGNGRSLTNGSDFYCQTIQSKRLGIGSKPIIQYTSNR